MLIRTALILAFLTQQLLLPAIGAHALGQCEASADVAKVSVPSRTTSCCAVPQSMDEDAPTGCRCAPSACGCAGETPQTPAAPDRNHRSVDQLVPMLGLPTAAQPALPRAHGAVRPAGRAMHASQHNRLQAILCIWRT